MRILGSSSETSARAGKKAHMLIIWEIDGELEKGWRRRVEEIMLKSRLAASDENAYYQEIGFDNF